eukprot:CAMPEP_0168615674 /NCGR_PEP_ID=MMETSP0449_2-20121227/4627_1 /TAXON_ID=1082188 /ORGANISM="Strombidium rassoulzadegani, Strain ras09" /LENGTH=281 /DNA_ID=CAMNT_0008656423 /DNA_START=34 /DNA_END=879 /DNA_ORIENTATION=+
MNNGLEMPSVGLGTASHQNKDSMVSAIMEAGYCHIDTAFIYKNEEVVGEALAECFAKGKLRSEVFVTTKLWHSQYGDVEGAIKESLQKLKLDYVDLYLIHWPLGYYSEPKAPVHKIWPQMESLVEKGLTKSIGVSNFNNQLVWDLLTYAKILPVCNQVELNPQCPQPEVVKFLLAKNIIPVAYTPVARPGAVENGDALCPPDWPDLRKDEFLQGIAKKYNKSVVQVMLNWGLCRGHCVIPKAAGLDHQKENLDIFDFKLTEEECQQIIERCGKGIRLCNKF